MTNNQKPNREVKHHRQLDVWQKAMTLAVEVFQVARALPTVERFGMAQQMRSAAVSIAANIAEGKGRTQPRDFARFIGIARGSAYELDTYLVLAQRFKYLAAGEVARAEELLEEIRRMLTGLLRRLTPL
jgi:four helix bundle protein